MDRYICEESTEAPDESDKQVDQSIYYLYS